MKFPLTLSFKIVALAPQITVTDADGNSVCYVRQKLFKLKEAVEVFTNKDRSEKICDIKANKILDFSASYHFYNTDGEVFGCVRRKGMRSLWKAHYEILDHETPEYEIREENPWTKVLDGLLGEIPVIGFVTGYVLNPKYLVSKIDGDQEVVRITKQPAFWEGRFQIEELSDIDEQDEVRVVLSTLMMVLLEKRRG